MSSTGRTAKAFSGFVALVMLTGYCLLASAESPPADSIEQLEALIEQQESLIKQQEALIEQQESKVKKQNNVVSQPETVVKQSAQAISTDNKQEPNYISVSKGKLLFKKWCIGCHDPKSTAYKIGPGIKGILKKKKLPASGRAATTDNINRQMQKPYKLMPLQFGLTDEEIDQLIKYLETL